MRVPLLTAAAISLLTGSALAFPAFDKSNDAKYAEFLKRAAEIKSNGGASALWKRQANNSLATPDNGFGQRRLTAVIDPANFKFNDEEQSVDLTSDEHKFIAPGPNDIRGPCPGLNLLANHGYLNRNGVTTLTQGIDAIRNVFGVEEDLALALNAYAVVFNGNIADTTWSIGGPYTSSGVGAVSDLLLGQPQGIDAHNIYEGDASIVRRDYYQPGANEDNVSLYLPYFKDLLALGGNDATVGRDTYNAELMLQHKANRWHQSVAENPFFFNSAFGGLVVTTAAERFVAEFAANNTADANGYNRIYLDEKNLLAFFSVDKAADGTLTYTPGHEHLIPGWKRRPLAATFGLDDIALTLLNAASIDPSLLSVGGNTGKVNSFAGVDAGDITGGAIHTSDLLNDPQALACFLYQAGVEEVIPTQVNALYKVTSQALAFVGANIKPAFQSLATAGNNPCTRYTTNAVAAYNKFPGSKIERNGQTGLLGTLAGALTGGVPSVRRTLFRRE